MYVPQRRTWQFINLSWKWINIKTQSILRVRDIRVHREKKELVCHYLSLYVFVGFLSESRQSVDSIVTNVLVGASFNWLVRLLWQANRLLLCSLITKGNEKIWKPFRWDLNALLFLVGLESASFYQSWIDNNIFGMKF